MLWALAECAQGVVTLLKRLVPGAEAPLALYPGQHASKMATSEVVRPAVPGLALTREWVRAPTVARDDAAGARFSVVSYNILAPCYTEPLAQRYGYLKGAALATLEWEMRGQQVVEELLALDADVLCLQEVEGFCFAELQRALAGHGYSGVFARKSTERFEEGVATFVRRFKIAEQREVVFNNLVASAIERSGPESGLSRTDLELDTVALLLVVEDKQLGRIVISNCHIHYGFQRPERQAMQVGQLMRAVEALRRSAQADAVVLAGDFNSRTDSIAYRLLRSGKLNFHDVKATRLFSALPRRVMTDVIRGLDMDAHELYLGSAYREVRGREPRFTNYAASFQGTLDYIWFSPALRPVGVLDMVAGDSIQEYGHRAPNPGFPSDHLSLKAEFVMAR